MIVVQLFNLRLSVPLPPPHSLPPPHHVQALQAKLSLDALLQMTGAQVKDTMRRLGSSSEECARLIAALSCLKSAAESGTSTLTCHLPAAVLKLSLSCPPSEEEKSHLENVCLSFFQDHLKCPIYVLQLCHWK